MAALLPQLESATYSSQIFWLFITFFILYFSISKYFLPNIIDLIKRRHDYINKIEGRILYEKEKIDDTQIRHALLISKKNDEIAEIAKSANQKANEIRLDGNEAIQRGIKSLNNEMFGKIKNSLNAEKNELQNECASILLIFSEKFGISLESEDLNTELAGAFEKLWYKNLEKLKN